VESRQAFKEHVTRAVDCHSMTSSGNNLRLRSEDPNPFNEPDPSDDPIPLDDPGRGPPIEEPTKPPAKQT
jgi:hypothetical protein